MKESKILPKFKGNFLKDVILLVVFLLLALFMVGFACISSVAFTPAPGSIVIVAAAILSLASLSICIIWVCIHLKKEANIIYEEDEYYKHLRKLERENNKEEHDHE